MKHGVWARFYISDDLLLVRNIYTYFEIEDDYFLWFERCIKKYNLEENEDYIIFKHYENGREDIDHILLYSNKSRNLIDDEREYFDKNN